MNLFLREWLNAALIPLNVCILLIITHQLAVAFLGRDRTKGLWDWTNDPGVGSACAFWWIFVAELIRAVLAWTYLYKQRVGTFTNEANALIVALFAVASLIAFFATFRLIYTLSPDSWGHRSWVAAAGSSVVFVVFLQVVL